MEDSKGKAVFEEHEILEVITDYFSKLFTTTNPPPSSVVDEALFHTVEANYNGSLAAIPTPKEIKEVVFSIHPDKAPGPDGFTSGFFCTNWDTVGPAISEEIIAFFRHDTLPLNFNHTHIRLITKIPGPKSVADYKPNALYNVYYKIVSKILTRRLQPFLDTIISENQSAFIRGEQ